MEILPELLSKYECIATVEWSPANKAVILKKLLVDGRKVKLTNIPEAIWQYLACEKNNLGKVFVDPKCFDSWEKFTQSKHFTEVQAGVYHFSCVRLGIAVYYIVEKNAWGIAIDGNPFLNPFTDGSKAINFAQHLWDDGNRYWYTNDDDGRPLHATEGISTDPCKYLSYSISGKDELICFQWQKLKYSFYAIHVVINSKTRNYIDTLDYAIVFKDVLLAQAETFIERAKTWALENKVKIEHNNTTQMLSDIMQELSNLTFDFKER